MHVVEFLDRGVRINPNGIAFTDPEGESSLTYAEVEDITHRMAGALIRDGVAPGTPVAVLSANSTVVFPYILGILRAGCIWTGLNARSAPADLAALLELVEARILFCTPEFAETGKAIQRSVATLERVIHIGGSEHNGGPTLEQWLEPPGTRVPLPEHDPEATAAFVGTGGTTGRSKAVAVPHRAFETMIHAFNAHMPERDPVHLVAAPMTHAAGAMVFPVLSLGGCNIVHDGVSPAAILDSIERHKVTRLFLPPTAIYALLAHPDCRTRDTSSLRYFMYGAAPMSVEKLKEALEVFGPVMAQAYGQAELPVLCTFLSPEEHAEALADETLAKRLASCGQQSLVATVAIMDDDGNLVPQGERGEIVVRSSLRMNGYHRNVEQTQAVARKGDWLATGDVGYIDEDGYVYIVDRKRDVIITGGFNVYPSEVEQVIWGRPEVEDCAVIGLPDEKWGERVTAVVELKDGADGDEEDLIAACKEALGSVKAPKQVIFRSLPRSPVGKVLKRELRDEYWTGLERKV